jgi:peptidoglycan/LPS O-acetylase OafA/YrhL
MVNLSLNNIHYPNLNFLRFIAASIVIICHIEQLKFIYGYDSQWAKPIFSLVGKLGVDFFFVLSGFLITSLLMREKDVLGKVHVKEFILRRIYRIWPLYFIIVALAFFAAPWIPFLQLPSPFIDIWPHFAWSVGLYVLFLPHVQAIFIGPIAYCSQCWSIGIEEYFYFIWPFIIHKINRKATVYFIISFVLLYIATCLLTIHLGNTVYAGDPLFAKICDFVLKVLKFDCLLIGCFFALLNSYLGKRRTFVTSKLFQIFIFSAELFLVWKAYQFGGLYWEVHAVLYGFIVLNFVREETSLLSFEKKGFDYLGKISYGIYMYHPLVVGICVKILCKHHLSLAVHPAAFGGTILLSALSYRYIERYFLRRKLAHSYIQTG